MLERMHFTGQWRDYQARVLSEMAEHSADNRLHIVAAPGAGKTVLGLEIVRRIGRPAVIFAPNLAIREQWVQRLCPLFLTAPPDAADISRNLSDPRTMTLATYQALDSFRRGDGLESLIAQLNRHGPLTLVLDEAHHLRREWWVSLNTLAEQLDEVQVVALTATPPYDASFAEWSRYEGLCGSIDLEIGIPELVRNGDLCPHQDHVILSEPTAVTLSLLEERRAAIADLQAELCADAQFLDWLTAHPWLAEPQAHVEAILDAPEMLSAVLVMLNAAGRYLPKPPLHLLGVSARDVPLPSHFWLERLLDGLLFRHKDAFALDAARLKDWRDRLHRHGLIEGGKVRMHQSQSLYKAMSASLAKLDSITAIAKTEHAALGEQLRMVVLSDHIRAGELPTRAAASLQRAKLGVAPIFETLRRAAIAPDYLAVLTGSLVLLPRAAVAALHRLSGLSVAAPFMVHDVPACPDHVRVEACGTGPDMVHWVTKLFLNGDIRIVVGTQSLLGEGWDAPALNSLILASNTASFMLSNQMRGRAIRMDPARPDKVANIWHLATVDPSDDTIWTEGVDALNWGDMADGTASFLDLGTVVRRFKAYVGIANGASTLIEDGVARLGLNQAVSIDANNRRSFAMAVDRARISERWQVSLGEGEPRSHVRETAAPRYAPRALSWAGTLQAAAVSATGSGAFAAANELSQVASYANLGMVAMGVTGAATLASLPQLLKAGRLTWRNGSLEGSLRQVTQVVVRALTSAGVISEAEAAKARIEIRDSVDGRKDVTLAGVTRATERQVMQALSEILGPVQNPRYLLVRTSWLALKRRTDYHAVPTALGARKEYAEQFAKLWRENVGGSDLIFARTPEGRRTLLRARARSLAGGLQRAVERRSVWL